MPGVDYNMVQLLVPMAKVLKLVGFVALTTAGDQLHGSCPIHKSESRRSRTFSVPASQAPEVAES